MHRDVDDDTGFSMAVPGSLTALCLSSCWNRLAWIDLFQRRQRLLASLSLAVQVFSSTRLSRLNIYFVKNLSRLY